MARPTGVPQGLRGAPPADGRPAGAGVPGRPDARSRTFVFANDGSNRSYRDIGVPRGPPRPVAPRRQQGQAGEDPEDQPASTSTQLAYLLDKLKAVKEGDGTLLDNCMIVYGSGISDGNRHNHDDLPILLAGKGGGTSRRAGTSATRRRRR